MNTKTEHSKGSNGNAASSSVRSKKRAISGSEFTCGGLSLGRSTIEGDGTSIESNSEPDVFIGVTSIVDEAQVAKHRGGDNNLTKLTSIAAPFTSSSEKMFRAHLELCGRVVLLGEYTSSRLAAEARPCVHTSSGTAKCVHISN